MDIQLIRYVYKLSDIALIFNVTEKHADYIFRDFKEYFKDTYEYLPPSFNSDITGGISEPYFNYNGVIIFNKINQLKFNLKDHEIKKSLNNSEVTMLDFISIFEIYQALCDMKLSLKFDELEHIIKRIFKNNTYLQNLNLVKIKIENKDLYYKDTLWVLKYIIEYCFQAKISIQGVSLNNTFIIKDLFNKFPKKDIHNFKCYDLKDSISMSSLSLDQLNWMFKKYPELNIFKFKINSIVFYDSRLFNFINDVINVNVIIDKESELDLVKKELGDYKESYDVALQLANQYYSEIIRLQGELKIKSDLLEKQSQKQPLLKKLLKFIFGDQ